MRDKIISIILIVLGIFLIGYGSIESMNINNKAVSHNNRGVVVKDKKILGFA